MTLSDAATLDVPARAVLEEAAVPSLDGAMNKTAFQVFYKSTAPGLRSYIQNASGSSDLADDIVQDAFLRFLRAAPAGLEAAQQKAYLYRIAERLVVDYRRRLRREQLWNWREYLGRRPSVLRELELSLDLQKVFQTLKGQQKALLWLAYVEGFGHREIADILGLREQSVRVLLFRARRKLVDLLTKRGLRPGVRP